MNVHLLNPLSDTRWDALVARHPRATAFHQRGWLEALARTYGYEPFVLTSAASGEPLKDGVVLCRISSWLTGTRLVSLPFADHCDPLWNDSNEAQTFSKWLREENDRNHWKYVELRPLTAAENGGDSFRPSRSYWYHELDLTPSFENLFGHLHYNSFRRKIRRAGREHITYEVGNTDRLLEEFYRLQLLTRRRHQLLPQPRTWFNNLAECMGKNMEIRVARKNGISVAAMLSLRHGSNVVFKYGCSDATAHSLGGMPFLFWKLIEESKNSGAEKIDFGRSDTDQEGLILFKDRLGTHKKLLTYYRYANSQAAHLATMSDSLAVHAFSSVMPDSVLSVAGRLLYRHIG